MDPVYYRFQTDGDGNLVVTEVEVTDGICRLAATAKSKKKPLKSTKRSKPPGSSFATVVEIPPVDFLIDTDTADSESRQLQTQDSHHRGLQAAGRMLIFIETNPDFRAYPG